ATRGHTIHRHKAKMSGFTRRWTTSCCATSAIVTSLRPSEDSTAGVIATTLSDPTSRSILPPPLSVTGLALARYPPRYRPSTTTRAISSVALILGGGSASVGAKFQRLRVAPA